MRRSILLLFLLSLGLAAQASAQARQFGTTGASVRVQVTFTDDRPASARLKVELVTSGSEVQLNTAFTDDNGVCEFGGVRPGTYRVRVSGIGIRETVGRVFSISRGQATHFEYLPVERVGENEVTQTSTTATVAAADLNVPGKARKEYEKGGEAMEKGNWEGARVRFEEAIRLYPQYAAAHNDLGVVYMNTGQTEKGREMFETAVRLNDRYARAYRNLGILHFHEKSYPMAETSLQKALAGDPLDVQTLTMLAQVQLLLHKPLEAATTATRVHDLPHEQFVACHLIAARAYELLNKETDAMAEYTIFLKESPQNPNAPKVRAALDALKARTH
ncbi:MAG TPA: tetratricopeptide repeat protein [Terriglobales bacterium]|nr:tetratricopeptide repeat protein [Terriglobales bacterium]